MPTFPEEQRTPFSYFDGAKTVFCDPLAIFRQILIRTRGKPNELANRVFAVKPDTKDIDKLMDSWAAAEELVAMVRDLFHMQPFNQANGTGARDENCWQVWDAFCEFMFDAKKKGETTPTSLPPTASPPTSSQPTPSGSASS